MPVQVCLSSERLRWWESRSPVKSLSVDHALDYLAKYIHLAQHLLLLLLCILKQGLEPHHLTACISMEPQLIQFMDGCVALGLGRRAAKDHEVKIRLLGEVAQIAVDLGPPAVKVGEASVDCVIGRRLGAVS